MVSVTCERLYAKKPWPGTESQRVVGLDRSEAAAAEVKDLGRDFLASIVDVPEVRDFTDASSTSQLRQNCSAKALYLLQANACG